MSDLYESTTTVITNILNDNNNYSNISYDSPTQQKEIVNSEFAIKLNNLLYSNQFYVAIAILWSSITILSIFGNGLVILNALIFKKLNDLTNCYIFNLAITDLLFTIFCIPFTTYLYLFDDWFFGTIFCKLNHFMSHASVQSTCLTLTAMTIHRCNLIVNNKTITLNAAIIEKRRKHVLYITSAIWLVSFILASPDLIYYTVLQNTQGNETYSLCLIDTNTSSILKYYISVSNFVSIATTYGIPLIIIISSYAKLISHLSRNQNRLARFANRNTNNQSIAPNNNRKPKITNGLKKKDLESVHLHPLQVERSNLLSNIGALPSNTPHINKQQHKPQNKKRKVTIMVVLVTVNFAVCWLPTHLFIIIKRSVAIEQNSDEYIYLSLFKIIAHTLSYLTPVINPCLYAFFNENFRSSFYDLWLKLTCRYK